MSLFEELLNRETKLSLVGLGYVGMPIAVAFAKKIQVVGFDLNEHKIELYKNGIDPTNEVGNEVIKNTTVDFTADPSKLREAKFHIVAVPTPVNADHTPDLTPVEGASRILGQNLTKGSVVVFESTVYPGVTEDTCVPILEKESGLKCGVDFKIGYSPERINPGDKVHRLETITKIVSGMDEETLEHIFDRTYTGGHGFGLLNCKGIIDKYKKISSLFSPCNIQAESEPGKGSKFTFRLPCGIRKMQMILMLALMLIGCNIPSAIQGSTRNNVSMHRTDKHRTDRHWGNKQTSRLLQKAASYADSAYFSNINGTYERTLAMADSSRSYLNRYYLTLNPDGKYLMVAHPMKGTAAEIQWLHDSLPTNYEVILDIRNESAVAALALHKWELYDSNNKVYTQLFRERSADNSLDNYVRTMQTSENSKAVAIVLLIILLLQLPLAYYLLYYRHILRYRYAVEKINGINKVLLSGDSNTDKLKQITGIWTPSGSNNIRNVQLFPQLNEVVERISQALKQSIDMQQNEATNIEMAEDELHRAEYENGKLHIANSVLDNCLSTLKHETMYYPSRIRQLIDSTPEDVTSLQELVDYYKAIYTAMEQVEGTVKCDADLLAYLRKLITGGVKNFTYQETAASSAYVTCQYILHDIPFDATRHPHLFTPLTSDMKYLVARQIVREIGEATNLRGCGILAKPSSDGKLMIEIVLPEKIIKTKI